MHQDAARHRIVVIGAGFAGLGLGAKLRAEGIEDFVLLERGDDVGGTWRDNRYPGCQCDVASDLYSFSFAPNPDWSRTYSTQPEIQAYLRRCADDFGLRPHLRLRHTVLEAAWDADAAVWRIATDQGPYEAEVLVSAHGGLSEPAYPDLAGLDTFEGTTLHSAAWPDTTGDGRALDLTGRVAVIGTGASAVQLVPHLQRTAAHLSVFQRTPGWVVPHTDRAVRPWERRLYRRFPLAQKLRRARIYLMNELLVFGMAKNPRLLRPIQRLATAHLRQQVPAPELRRRLTPRFAPGCKRLLRSNEFYPALTADNVDLVTAPIVEVTPGGLVTDDGVKHEVDTLVFATGFRITDAPMAARVRGADGRTLAETWGATGPRAYLGTTVPGFPNLFLLSGPNTGIGHTSLVYMIESQLPYVLGAVRHLEATGAAAVDLRPEVADRWDDELQAKLAPSVWNSGGCASWYLHENGRNPTLWPDFTFRFRRLTRRFDAEHYRTLPFPAPPPAVPAPAAGTTSAEATA